MTSMIRSSIRGLDQSKRSIGDTKSSSSLSVMENLSSSSSVPIKISAMDQILHADKSGKIH